MVEVPGTDGALKSAAAVRAERRLYDGAPPVIAHEDFGIECTRCHAAGGIEIEGVGYAPPLPHGDTQGLSDESRCRQCHVFAVADGVFVENDFVGLRQDLRVGRRLHVDAPPTIPHKVFMRENCVACHTGPAAREEIRTSHPERVRCRQCHVPVTTLGKFSIGGSSS
jgi:cytochrome c-type protein NapB